MTVHYFNPRFTNEDDWCCSSVNKISPWCLAISDCIWNYMYRFYDIECNVKTCEWPLTRDQFNQKWWKGYRKGFKTYEEYIASNPKVEYKIYQDNQFYGLKNTDGTCTFAYQNVEYVFIIHIKSDFFKKTTNTPEGFGCVIDKTTNEIHCVALGEDDGNYWGDNDIDIDMLNEFDLGIITSIINEMSNNLFVDKSKLIEYIFNKSNNI